MVVKVLDDFCGTPLWDDQLLWNSTNPRLTPCFEYTVLVWTPCIFLWLCGPLECYFQKKSVQKTLPWTGANISRMVIALALSILSAINILDSLLNKYHEKYYLAVVAASSLKTLTFLFAVILMLLNRKRGRHTSGILFIFWFFLLLCEIFPYRSAFLDLQDETSYPDDISFVTHMIYFPLLTAETILCFIADIRYRHPLPPKDGRKESPERVASFPSKLLFCWFNSLCYLGWKRPLTVDDLYDLNPEDRTEYISSQFEKHYRHSTFGVKKSSSSVEEEKSDGEVPKIENGIEHIVKTGRADQSKKKINIIRPVAKTFSGCFLVGSLQKLIYDLLQFVNPLILKLLISYVESNDPVWIGVLYASFTIFNGTLQSMILGSYFQRMFVLGMRVRTALVSAIYKKSLVLSPTAKKESTVGEIVNLMSVDSQRFMDLMTYLNLIWSAPLQIIVALLMLFNVLGYAVLSGLLVSVILIPINGILANQIKKRQTKQMKYKDERVKLINEVLSGIKVLKLYAWEEAFKEKIMKIREKEVNHLKGIAYLNSFSMMLWSCAPFLVALVSFATFVLMDEKNQLDASTAFVSLSLFNILRFPLTMLPHLITTMVMTGVSVKRINKFMNTEELEQYVIHDSTSSSSICVRNGVFAWDKPDEDDEKKESKPTLSNINLIVPKKSLIAVVGQVGSGKSSLFSAILGDMDKLEGSVTLNGKVAYVSQQPWIQNSTLQNNILFSKPMSKKEYNDILECCSLKQDLEILPGGDMTEIGEKGINLSGGQKQRVSLARAVYSAADIYLLDDPLSAVDSHVGKHIFDQVIGPKGLLRSKTRVLVTHSLTYLPQTDMIYVMKEGMIAEKGSFQELVASKGPFADFLAQYGSEIETEDLSDLPLPPELLRSLSNKSNTPDDVSSINESSELNESGSGVMSVNRLLRKRSSSLSTSIEKSSSLRNSPVKLINVETAETGQVKFAVYIQYMKAIRYNWVAIILAAYTLWQLFSVGSNVWLSEWGNDPHLNDTSDHSQRDYRLGVYGALGFAQATFVFIGSFAVAYGTLAAANILHSGLLMNILRSPMSFFDTTPLGRIVNRFAKDVDTVDVTIPMTLRSWLSCLLQVISTLIIISFQTPLFLVVVLPISIIYYVIQRFYLSTSRQLKRLDSITKSPIYSHFSETLSGATTIRAYKAEERFCSLSNSYVDNNQICYYPTIVSNRWLAIRLDFCGNIIIFFSALFAILQRDTLDSGQVGLSVTYAFMVTATLNWMVRMSSELETNIVAVERILEYMATPTEAEWVLKDKRPPAEWPQHGAVKMKDYSTRYRANLDLVLKRICCDIKSGEKIGIVGRTGAGKSSLTLSLFRIIEAAEGSISIDDQTISEMGLHDLRSKITIIPQDPVLFSGTLRMNLDPFDWYSDAQLWEALEHAHLKNFVSSLDEGLEHEVVEGGENLSVGQRQLVCLARALLRKTQILVLDEATAAVDLETDSLIQVTIREEFKDASVLTIAHRLNTVMDYDRIMVLDQGEVAEFEPPSTLLMDKKSIFYGMAKDAGLV